MTTYIKKRTVNSLCSETRSSRSYMVLRAKPSATAREMPELSSRQLAAWIIGGGFSVSESTVYRILDKGGLVKKAEVKMVAGKEYHRKTTAPHQMWATDASYFRVSHLGLLLYGHRHG